MNRTLFISQPMSGLTHEEIMKVRNEATQYIESKYPDDNIIVLPSYQIVEPNVNYNAMSAVNLLGHAISLMGGANIIYFVPGWRDSKGCQIENEVARRWLEPTGVELIEAGMESIDIELSDDELNALKAAANKMGVSLNKFVEIKLPRGAVPRADAPGQARRRAEEPLHQADVLAVLSLRAPDAPVGAGGPAQAVVRGRDHHRP